MRRISSTENISLDGVMQAPAMPDEDTAAASPAVAGPTRYADQVMIDYMTAGSGDRGLPAAGPDGPTRPWPPTGRTCREDNPFTSWINAMAKYVASTTLTAPLDWNATLLVGRAGRRGGGAEGERGTRSDRARSGVLVQTLRATD